MIRSESSVAHANGNGSLKDEPPKVFDLRSDALSIPPKEIWSVMFNTGVGSTEVNEDAVTFALEKKAASLFEKEDSVLVPTGLMGNLVSILVHCNARPSEVLIGDQSHTNVFEQAGPSQFGGISMRTVKNKPDGTFDIDELKSLIRTKPMWHPTTRLICVKNTHNMCGGRIVPLEWLDEVVDLAKSRCISLHMDGARIFNASVKTEIPLSRIVRGFDSVTVSLSKGLGCPYGSILLGSKKFISEARRVLKAIGGGIRQTSFLAAAGIYALDNMMYRMRDDHEHIQIIGNLIRDEKHPYIKVPSGNEIHTNILNIYLDTSHVTTQDFLSKLETVSKDGPNVVIKAYSFTNDSIRFVLCGDSKLDIKCLFEKIRYVMNELR